MNRLINPTTVRVVLLPLLSILGTVAVMVWPLGHKAFCAGIAGVVI